MKQRNEFESRGAKNGVNYTKYRNWLYIVLFVFTFTAAVIAHEDRLKGYAKASEVQEVKEQVEKIDEKQDVLEKEIIEKITRIETHLGYIAEAIKRLNK